MQQLLDRGAPTRSCDPLEPASRFHDALCQLSGSASWHSAGRRRVRRATTPARRAPPSELAVRRSVRSCTHVRSVDRESQLAALSDAPRTPIADDDADEWVGPSLDRVNADPERRPRAARSSSSAVEIKVQLPPNRQSEDDRLIERMQQELDEMDGDSSDLERRLAALKSSSLIDSSRVEAADEAEWLGPPPGEVCQPRMCGGRTDAAVPMAVKGSRRWCR